MSQGGQLIGQAVEAIPVYPRGPGAGRTNKGDQAVQAFYAGDDATHLALRYSNKGSAVSMAGQIRRKYPELTVKVGPVEGSGDAGVYLSR